MWPPGIGARATGVATNIRDSCTSAWPMTNATPTVTGPRRRPASRNDAVSIGAPMPTTERNEGACPPPSMCAAHDKNRAAAVRANARARRHLRTPRRCMPASVRLRSEPASGPLARLRLSVAGRVSVRRCPGEYAPPSPRPTIAVCEPVLSNVGDSGSPAGDPGRGPALTRAVGRRRPRGLFAQCMHGVYSDLHVSRPRSSRDPRPGSCPRL